MRTNETKRKRRQCPNPYGTQYSKVVIVSVCRSLFPGPCTASVSVQCQCLVQVLISKTPLKWNSFLWSCQHTHTQQLPAFLDISKYSQGKRWENTIPQLRYRQAQTDRITEVRFFGIPENWKSRTQDPQTGPRTLLEGPSFPVLPQQNREKSSTPKLNDLSNANNRSISLFTTTPVYKKKHCGCSSYFHTHMRKL